MIKVTGASDDLIEIYGDIREEFNWISWLDEDSKRFLAFSDGTLLRVRYDEDGIWRFDRLISGTAQYSKVDGDVQRDTFDVVTLKGDISWVVLATDYAAKKDQRETPQK